MVTPLGWLERVPTYKEALENIEGKDLRTYGFLGYPVLQTADIVMYGEPNLPLFVPVGEDQVAHVELSREVVRRFNSYRSLDVDKTILHSPKLLLRFQREWRSLWDRRVPIEGGVELFDALLVFIRDLVEEIGFDNFIAKYPEAATYVLRKAGRTLSEPTVMLTHTPRIPGTDGRKMSKSYNNFIALGEDDESIRKKTKVMLTDPARKLRTDPGDPDVCPVFSWHKLFSTDEVQHRIRRDCTTAAIGCVDCKQIMSDGLIKWIEPVRARRKEYESKPGEVLEILDAGSKKAREVARSTMARVREAVFGWNKLRSGIACSATTSAKKQNVKAGD